MILSRNILKRVGESRHPCRTPTVIRNQSPTVSVTTTAQHLDSTCVTHYFGFAKNTDSAPQTFAHGDTTEAQTFQRNSAGFLFVRAIADGTGEKTRPPGICIPM